MPQNARNPAAASAFQFLSFFFISTPAIQFSRHFNAAFPTVRCYFSHLPNQQFVTEFNQITASIILMLQTFLQLKYQSITDQKDSPFSTHSIVMNVAVYSSAAHFFAYGTDPVFYPPSRLSRSSSARLLRLHRGCVSSVVLPNIAAPFVYAVFGLLSAAELLIWLHRKLAKDKDEEEEAELWIQTWRILRFFNNLNQYFYAQRTMPRLLV